MIAEKLNMREKTLYILVGVLIILFILGGYFLYSILKEKENLLNQVGSLTSELSDKINENKFLFEALEAEQNKMALLQNQINDIGNVVGDLDKLSKTDPELLQKYSKVYFLNEHYVPDKLTQISSKYVDQPDKDIYLRDEIKEYLEDMMAKAKRSGVELKVVSAYRSFDTQNSLKSNYSVTYGAGSANQFSADQGYSEHQLGTTVDFTTEETSATLNGFETTKAYKWLLDNAHRYGFTLSYSEDNTYYVFEPWHWRFVGTDLAGDLDRKNNHFYDLDQREIDTYLIEIFD